MPEKMHCFIEKKKNLISKINSLDVLNCINEPPYINQCRKKRNAIRDISISQGRTNGFIHSFIGRFVPHCAYFNLIDQ